MMKRPEENKKKKEASRSLLDYGYLPRYTVHIYVYRYINIL